MNRRTSTPFLVAVLVSTLTLYFHIVPVSAQPSEVYITSVPYHRQSRSYWCGPAALEMVFDFYGPDIPQIEIADVARTAPAGTYTPDMVRAAHFSNLSTSVGKEYFAVNFTGYTARQRGYAAFERFGLTLEDLKTLIAAGYPIIVLTTWHFRVAVGYNQTHFTFQDSYYGSMYNMAYAEFDTDWSSGSGHWGLFISPWNVNVSAAKNVVPGQQFTVTANITYPCFPPLWVGQYPAYKVNATITLPEGVSLVPEENVTKQVGSGYLDSGASSEVTWTVQANTTGNHAISVEADALVNGMVPELNGYPAYEYEDRIGGSGQTIVAVTSEPDETPPMTNHNCTDLWNNDDFTVNLTAEDDLSGVMETYYTINNGLTRAVSIDGQPHFTTESTNNTLEYWSIDWAGNEETHNSLTEIKLDKTAPVGSVLVNDNATYTDSSSVILSIFANDTTSGVAQMRLSEDNVTWTPWEPYNTSRDWNLTSDEGACTVYAQFNDNSGLISTIYTDRIIFDSTPATIGTPTRTPEGDVEAGQEVRIAVNVTDLTSGVKNVTLSYSLNNESEWTEVLMILNATSGHYEALIPGQNASTQVAYKIVAYDEVENFRADDNAGQYYTFAFIPEFDPLIFMLLFGTLTLIIIAAKRTKHTQR